ncbi:protein MtfA [mine drainage metagenome]|uniref:Protein MtfA n=1 Tax=mine drainage metagenome TaxID=410659 RepID=A0A1J5U0R9_9ZZZZ
MQPLATALQHWRMRRILKRHLIPLSVWHKVTRRIAVLNGLDSVQMAHLREMTAWFLDQKLITGAQGLEVTLSMGIAVASQACLLILNLGVDHFNGWVEVILYPSAFRVSHAQMDTIGLIHNESNVLSGESWLRGPVILSWDDVERDTYHNQNGHNVVLHEFAHKLDGLNGAMNGMPPLRGGMSRKTWSAVMTNAYDALCQQVAAGKSTHINPYAATNPAEFFAVFSEYFFSAPDTLKKHYPEVYEQFALFYLQPASR